LALVRVVEAVRRVGAGAGDAEREQHLPPVPRPEPPSQGRSSAGAWPHQTGSTGEEKKEDSLISRGKKQQKEIKSLCVRP
jgi:hypothetical protein